MFEDNQCFMGAVELYSWVSQRRIPFVKCGRLTKFDLKDKDIEQWIEENKIKENKFENDKFF